MAASAAEPATDPVSWDLAEGAPYTEHLTVLRTLGGGSRHEALLVWDERRLAVLVAKALRPDGVDDPVSLAMLEREARALAAVGHPVVVRGFDAVLDGPRPHLLLEHLEGATLRSVVRRTGPLALEQLLPLALHLAAALHHLHGLDLLHLDVKPDNVVLGAPPRLIDLSVATSLERARRLREVPGTTSYMAPEQHANDAAALGPWTDTFGLGATLHHAITGEKPFPGDDGHDARPLPRRTPPELAALVADLLAPEPADRPTARQVAERLEPLVAALPDRLVLSGRGLRPRRRRRTAER